MEEEEIKDINVIPLVDIMLVLLTIVLTTATFIVHGEIKVNLPESGKAKGTQLKDVLEIVITKERTIYVEGNEVSTEYLGNYLRQQAKYKEVQLKIDKEVTIDILVKTMEIVEEAGFEEISLVVRRR